jgi:predicted DNA-binding transcriptional regulator AlpA
MSKTLIPLATGLKKLCMSRSKYYDLRNPSSPRHDPNVPAAIPLGTGRSSPVALVEAEVDNYIAKLIERARSPEGAELAAARTAKAHSLVSARRGQPA